MSTPIPPLATLPSAPLPSDSGAAFDAKAFPFIQALNPYGNSVSAIALAAKANAEAALAAALAGDLPPITGQALKLLRVNAGETGLEFTNTVTDPVLNGTVTGTAIASQAEAEAGTVGNKAMTPLRTAQAIAAQRPLMSGYINETSNRAKGTTYTNSTGRTRAVAIRYSGSQASTVATVRIGGVDTLIQQGGQVYSFFFLVPPGVTYALIETVVTVTITSWLEAPL